MNILEAFMNANMVSMQAHIEKLITIIQKRDESNKAPDQVVESLEFVPPP